MNKKLITDNQSGQVVIILLLVMVITLGVGLSVVGRSTSEISTSTKTEVSTRAFSAAEAGLEKAFIAAVPTPGSTGSALQLNQVSNNSAANVDIKRLPGTGGALEYPPIGKGSFAQFWLADPLNINCVSPSTCYTPESFEIWFGEPEPTADYSNADEKPAIAVNLIYDSSTSSTPTYEIKRYVFDSNTTRSGGVGCSTATTIQTNGSNEERSFYCMVTVNNYSTKPKLVRIKLLYTNMKHRIAIKPVNGSFPPQAKVFTSVGSSGNVQRKLQVYQEDMVMPWAFDYALFSASDLEK